MQAFKRLAATLLLVAAALGCERAPLPKLGEVAPFTATKSDGSQLSSEQLRGSVWVGNLFFTSCRVVCPAVTAKVLRLHRRFDDPQFQQLSLSVDPATDQPEKLAEYAKKFGADTSRWHFVTTDMGSVTAIAERSLKLASPENPDLHSTRLVLVDREMNVRGFYRSEIPEEVTQLIRDTAALLKR